MGQIMAFIVRNGSAVTPFHLYDQYLDLVIAADEHVDLEQVFPEDQLYMSSVNPGALYTAINNGDIVRRTDADDADIAAANAFDDAIWRWSPTRQQKEALVGQPLTPNSTNKYLTQGVFSIKATIGGTQRYGYITFLEGTNVTITDNTDGSFTFASSGNPTWGSPVALSPDSGNVDGTAITGARSDHKHNVPTATAVSVGTTNAQGASTTNFSRADHVHQGIHSLKATALGTARYGDLVFLEGTNITITDDGAGNFTFSSSGTASYGSPVALSPDSGNIDGVATTVSRSDHKHNVPTATAVSVTTANAQGASTTNFSRADHAHQGIHALKANSGGTFRYGDLVFLAGTNTTITDDGAGNFTWACTFSTSYGSPVALSPDSGNVDGVATTAARSDHKHNVPTATAVSVTTANAQGASTTDFSRADHAHQGIHQLKVGSGGTARFGDLVFLYPNGVVISDDGAGNFTWDTIAGPNELLVTAANLGGSLQANFTAGLAMIDGTIYSISAGSINVGTNITNGYIYVNTSGTVTSGSTLPDGAVPLALFTSSGTAITALSNRRCYPNQRNTPGAVGDVTTIQPDDAASAGSSERWARADHKHAIVADTPVAVGSANSEGTSTSFARADHVHAGGTFLTTNVKAGTVASGSFTGSPRKATVTFGASFSSTSYAITITGIDARTWTYESKTTGGFTISANSASALSGEVSWVAIASGS